MSFRPAILPGNSVPMASTAFSSYLFQSGGRLPSSLPSVSSFYPSSLSLSAPRTRTSPLATTRFTTVAAQRDPLRVLYKAWNISKDGIEAGIKFVPDSVPRPVARVGVGGLAIMVTLFLLKSVISTAFFILAMMGFIYFVYLAISKDAGPSNGGSRGGETDDALEEARRIMDKYK